MITNPTGRGVRSDAGGDGHYGASRVRKKPDGSSYTYKHRGTDFSCTPGQPVKCPVIGTITRIARPYSRGEYSGCVIESPDGKFRMFYLEVNPDLIGQEVEAGQVIGVAQDISKKYRNVDPHVHLEILEYNPELLVERR